MTDQPTSTLEDTTELDPAERALVDEDELVADPEFVATLQKRRLITPATRVLLLLVVLGAGFMLGAYVQKHRASSTNTGLPSGLAQLLGRSGTQGAFGGSGNGLSGTVKLIDGNNVYISDAQGNVTKVVTTADTKIKVSKDGTLADLGSSKSVTVQGSQNADGTYTATSIQESSGSSGGFPTGGAPTGTSGTGLPSGGGAPAGPGD